MSLPPDVLAVVVDLYDTLVYVPLPPKDEQLTTLLGVSQDVLARAFAATGPTRWAGGYGSAEADMTATARACGLDHEADFIRDLTARNIAAWTGSVGAKAVGMSAFLIDRAGRHASPPPGADAVIHGLRELL
jgi:hypothetical protein